MSSEQLDGLRAQAAHHRRCWSEQTEGLKLATVLFRTHPAGPSVAWLLGHVLHEVDTTIEAVLDAERTLPNSFVERASHADWCVESQADWEQLRAHWSDACVTLEKGLKQLPAAALQEPCAVPIHAALGDALSTRLAWFQGHLFHLAYHLGQATLLRNAAVRNPLPPPQG
ncbi:MAG: hypothetical protein ACI8QC_003861 [Planctomycetota bacterium]|jgi:hypothetical protein